MKKLITIVMLVFSLSALAQEKTPVTEADYSNSSVEMADLMRSEGKIYVLVGIILIIFLGITFYLISTDKKISKLEKKLPALIKEK
ncbi:CcmD family protein [Algoriphagus sediminis]|uniref:CcmD family protein n=1 Tax=Algoriphagus sediminis TaxID=3057113 RepID=A0ABT7YCT8_9BACT|nr:CcmD family protein [Algoriphagus sediminis]MDN3204340.1 CcmD family protein [Algoriphagus sediminis]